VPGQTKQVQYVLVQVSLQCWTITLTMKQNAVQARLPGTLAD